MNLISLYYFVELAKELHVTNTAQKLYISQQNLSQHIQRLEQYYGVTLFHRKPKLALTYAGEQLFYSATKILAEEHELLNRLSAVSSNNVGSLKVGIPAYRAQICFPEILPSFYEKWPNVRIEMIDESSTRMEEMLFEGELDLFIGIMYQDHPKLEVMTILNDYIYLVCSDEFLKRYYQDSYPELKHRAGQGVDLKWFSRVPFMLPKPSMRLRKTLDTCFQEAKVTPRVFLESSTTELLISLCPYNYGAFFCTQMRLPLLFEKNPNVNVFPLKRNGEVMRHRLVLAYHKERYLPEYAKDFIEITKGSFRDIVDMRTKQQSEDRRQSVVF